MNRAAERYIPKCAHCHEPFGRLADIFDFHGSGRCREAQISAALRPFFEEVKQMRVIMEESTVRPCGHPALTKVVNAECGGGQSTTYRCAYCRELLTVSIKPMEIAVHYGKPPENISY